MIFELILWVSIKHQTGGNLSKRWRSLSAHPHYVSLKFLPLFNVTLIYFLSGYILESVSLLSVTK